MKKLLLTLALLLAAVYLFPQSQRPIVQTKDDPQARQAYEFNRIKNPYTGLVPQDIREKELAYVLSPEAGLQNMQKAVSINWMQRGPWNVGGRTRALALDLTNNNRIIAGGVSGGIWISTDGGTSWTKATIIDDAHSPAVTALAQDPSNPQIWYYAGGEYLGNSASETGASYRNGGVYKSTDGGLTWTKVYSSGNLTVFDSYLDYVWNMKVTTNGTLLVAAYGGILRSTDGGQTFSIVIDSDPNNYGYYSRCTDIEIATDGTIYAVLDINGQNYGVFKSTDDGQNWTNITPSSFNVHRTVLATAPSAPDTLYVLGYKSTDATGTESFSFWMYDNNSGTWDDRSANIPALGGQTGNFDSQGGYDLVIKVKPDDPNLVYIGGTNLFFSTDGFSTSNNTYWAGGYTPQNNSYANYTNHHPDQHSLVFDFTNPAILYSGHDGGISKTTNSTDTQTNTYGETVDWVSLDNGYMTTQAYAVALEPTGNFANILIAGFQDNGTWITDNTNLQTEWVRFLSGDGAFCEIAPNRKIILESSQNGSTYADLYDDNGNYLGWAYASPNLNDPLFIAPFALDPSGNILYYLDDTIVWRNADLYTNLSNNISNSSPPAGWTQMTNTAITGGDYFSAVSVSTSPANILFLGTANGHVYKILDANTGDPNPTEITGSNFPTGAYVSSIAVDPADANNLIVTFSNYGVQSIFYSSDGGSTWLDVSGNLEENPDGSGNGPSVRWAAILNYNGTKNYFVGTSTGLYRSDNITSGTWTQEAGNIIGNVVVDMVKTRSADGTIAVATHGNGIFTGQLASATSFINTTPTQDLKIYPNPVSNGIATITLPEAYGKLLIFNTNGQLVYHSTPIEKKHTLHLEPLVTGTYSVIYFSKGKTYTQKIIVQ